MPGFVVQCMLLYYIMLYAVYSRYLLLLLLVVYCILYCTRYIMSMSVSMLAMYRALLSKRLDLPPSGICFSRALSPLSHRFRSSPPRWRSSIPPTSRCVRISRECFASTVNSYIPLEDEFSELFLLFLSLDTLAAESLPVYPTSSPLRIYLCIHCCFHISAMFHTSFWILENIPIHSFTYLHQLQFP